MTLFVFLVFLVLLLVASFRWIVPILVAFATLVPFSEGFVIVGIELKFIRLLALASLIRLVGMGQLSFKLNQIDKVYLTWVGVGFIIYILSHRNGAAFIYRAGVAVDCVFLWLLARYAFERDWYGVSIRALGIALVVVSASVAAELWTGNNVFDVVGQPNAMWRDGKMRLYSAFDHPILMGSFFAAVIPLILALWMTKRVTIWMALIALSLALMCVFAAGSSGPIGAMLVGIVAMLGYRLRRLIFPSFWLLMGTLLVLHFFIMENSVWWLLARIDLTGSSTGWHRYWLMEQALNHWDEWILIGTRDITHWNVWYNDVTSMYVLQAISGGGVGLLAFFWLCWKLFTRLENSRVVEPDAIQPLLQWALLCSFLTHLASFMSVAYWGQTLVLFGFWVALYTSFPNQINPRRVPTSSRPHRPVTTSRQSAGY